MNPNYIVYKNGILLCVAGLKSETGVLNTILTWVKRKNGTESNSLTVRGLNSQENLSLLWLDESLAIGDEITIKVVQDANLTEATISPPFDEERYHQEKVNTYYRLREELKDYIENNSVD